jgi:hypothetical protein
VGYITRNPLLIVGAAAAVTGDPHMAARKKVAKKKTARRKAAKRELIDTGTNKLYVRRKYLPGSAQAEGLPAMMPLYCLGRVPG